MFWFSQNISEGSTINKHVWNVFSQSFRSKFITVVRDDSKKNISPACISTVHDYLS